MTTKYKKLSTRERKRNIWMWQRIVEANRKDSETWHELAFVIPKSIFLPGFCALWLLSVEYYGAILCFGCSCWHYDCLQNLYLPNNNYLFAWTKRTTFSIWTVTPLYQSHLRAHHLNDNFFSSPFIHTFQVNMDDIVTSHRITQFRWKSVHCVRVCSLWWKWFDNWLSFNEFSI